VIVLFPFIISSLNDTKEWGGYPPNPLSPDLPLGWGEEIKEKGLSLESTAPEKNSSWQQVMLGYTGQ